MTPFFDESGSVLEWVKVQLAAPNGFGKCRVLGVHHGGKIVAGVVFHEWDPKAGVIELSCAAIDRRWMTRTVMRTVFEYVFDGLNCQLAVARTDERNHVVRRIWKALGAKEYLIDRLGGRDHAKAILTLSEESWAQSIFAKEGR